MPRFARLGWVRVWAFFGLLCRAVRGNLQADPAGDRPDDQPRQAIPMRPTFVPAGNDRGDAHYFAENEEPQHVFPGTARGEAGTDQCADDSDHRETYGTSD